ncbi:hypothetical protein [Streptomyces sp. NPDC058394]|uniref:hypothetical protein n=1 Tax=Streptomyces sp. NPDC058394 TaxID=3346477 RepID=UPI003669D6B8
MAAGVALALGSLQILPQAAGAGGPRSPDGADLFAGGLVGQVRGTEVAAGGRVVDLDPVVVVRHEADPAGSVDDVDAFRVHRLELVLHERTQVLKYCRSKPEETPELRWWFSKRRFDRKGSVRFFQRALATAFRTTEQELSGLGFPARYPWSLSP